MYHADLLDGRSVFFAPPFSRPALLGGRRGRRRLSVVQGSYLLRSLSGFAPGSVSFSRDRVHSVPFFMPCMKNISLATLPYTAKRCGKLDCQAEAPCAFQLHRETVQTSPLCQAEAAIGRVLFHKWGGDVAASPPTPSRRQKIYIKEKEI